ncbi:MAG: PSP1 domain-containing protein [Pirellulales bacterium]
MITPHLVRVGVLGQVGRFVPVEPHLYPRGSRVVCRTNRGLEVGEVLAAAPATSPLVDAPQHDGQLLRRVTVEDDLLLARLERRKQEAFEACERLLAEHGRPAVLMDVEHLFDGGSLYFYFLGDPPTEVEQLTQHLAEAYDAAVQFRQFTDAVEAGCGPQCGTAEAAGCGASPGGCASCALSSACKK